MEPESPGPLKLQVDIEHWPLAAPFKISDRVFAAADTLRVTLEKDGKIGSGEAAGVYYRHETPALMTDQIERVRKRIEWGINREHLQDLLPPGGARNALDCALWDLEAKLTGEPVWHRAGLDSPRPLRTTFTCGAADPAQMAATARGYKNARAIKIKLTGAPIDADRVTAVRESLPHVWLGVDANQGFTRSSLEKLMPILLKSEVALIEQPFPVGQESQLDGLDSPIPIGADESLQGLADLPALAQWFDVINIKLDKCGGLTEGLKILQAAKEANLEPMVGCMPGTSLAMAPAFLLGQLCSIVDLDAPLFLKADRAITAQYQDGLILCPETLWG